MIDENAGQPQARINIADMDDVKCDACGDRRFEPVYLMKRLSALVSPSGQAELVPLGPPIIPQVFACYACGHVNEEFVPLPLRAAKQDVVTEPRIKLEH